MIRTRHAALFVAALVMAEPGFAQEAMTTDELLALTKDGRTIRLGGPGTGYSGELVLNADGTGKGAAETDSGKKLTLTGSWRIGDGAFCRKWKEFDDGAEVCETWKKTSDNSVDVYVGDNKVGVNSW